MCKRVERVECEKGSKCRLVEPLELTLSCKSLLKEKYILLPDFNEMCLSCVLRRTAVHFRLQGTCSMSAAKL